MDKRQYTDLQNESVLSHNARLKMNDNSQHPRALTTYHAIYRVASEQLLLKTVQTEPFCNLGQHWFLIKSIFNIF